MTFLIQFLVQLWCGIDRNRYFDTREPLTQEF